MLRTNLSTRPFYNERPVRLVLGVVALLVVAATAYNVVEAMALSRRHRELSAAIDRDTRRARDLRREATALEKSIAPAELAAVLAAAREANRLIDRRTFSWTALLNHVEETLPGDVMLVSITPTLGDNGMTVTMGVRGRSVAEIDRFMERLEETGAFSGLLSRDETADEDGTFRATLVGLYRAPGVETPAATAAPADTVAGEPASAGAGPAS